MKVVLGTNVIVSTFITPGGVPAAIYRRWEARGFELIVSESVLREYGRVSNNPHIQRLHGLDNGEIVEAIQALSKAEVFVNPGVPQKVVAADPDDDVFIACAVAGQADYIVSGDQHLLKIGEHRGIRILRPAVFLVLLNEERDLGD